MCEERKRKMDIHIQLADMKIWDISVLENYLIFIKMGLTAI